ncbi:MAG: hypothetical protein ACP5HQ_03135 [Thermoprotei archaeon]
MHPDDFVIKERVREFKGVVYNAKGVNALIRASSRLELRGRVVRAKLRREVNAEEVIRLGVRILEPFRLPAV